MVSMGTGFVPVAVGCQSRREIDAERSLGADERRVEMVEGVGKDRDGEG